MKVKFYKNTKDGKIVYENKIEEYVLNKLGIVINPKGKNGEMTLEQTEIIEKITNWFLNSDWETNWEDVE